MYANNVLEKNNLSKDISQDFQEFVKSDINNIKLDILKSVLQEMNIEFDNQISNYKELTDYLQERLDSNTLKIIFQKEKNKYNDIKDFLSNIENSAPLTAKKIINNFNNIVVKPTVKTVSTIGLSRALFDAMLFLPSPARTIVGVTTLGATIFKGVKGQLDKFKKEKSERYNNIIDKLQVQNSNEKVQSNQFNRNQINAISDFFGSKGININCNNYSDILNEIKKLNNKDKFDLIKILNDTSTNKLDINKELANERKIQKANKGKSNLLKLGLGATLGIIFANLDKEVFDLINPLIPKEVTEMIYKARTLYSNNHTYAKSLVPTGLLGTSALSLLTNSIIFLAKTIMGRSNMKKNIEKQDTEKFTDSQKLIMEVLKNNLLKEHPEYKDEILEINNLKKLKDFINKFSDEENKSLTNVIVDLKNLVNKKNETDKLKELGKMFTNSALLAGNSMLAYQILLFLKDKLIITPPGDNTPKPETGKPQPQEEPAVATAPTSEKNPSIVSSTNPISSPAVNPTPVPSPVPAPVPATTHVQSNTPSSIPSPVPTPQTNTDNISSQINPSPSIESSPSLKDWWVSNTVLSFAALSTIIKQITEKALPSVAQGR